MHARVANETRTCAFFFLFFFLLSGKRRRKKEDGKKKTEKRKEKKECFGKDKILKCTHRINNKEKVEGGERGEGEGVRK